MPKRSRLDVSPNKREGGWTVKVGNNRSRFDTKQAAINAAVSKARELDDAQVIIHKKDGTIQSERTYGNDPRRTRG
jgi:hypothetical protein